MSIYISYHPLDYNFAHELLIYVRNLGLQATLFTSKFREHPGCEINSSDKLIAILRPEYFQSASYIAVTALLKTISDFYPVLRMPISIDEWSANGEFRPVIDFTDHANESFEQLRSMLLSNIETPGSSIPTPKEIYLNSLESTLHEYIGPIISLEMVNFECALDENSPINVLLGRTPFMVGTLNRQLNHSDSYQWNREDFLNNIIKYHRSFTIASNDFDPSAITFHIVNSARIRATTDKNEPIPVVLDVEHWRPDISWTDWLLSQIPFTNTPLEDVASGKCTLYIYGLDLSNFKTHPQKQSFEEWLHSPYPPRHFVIICTYLTNLEKHYLSDVVIVPAQYDLLKYRDLCMQFKDRRFSRFVVNAVDNQITIPPINYLLTNPILAALLLSVKFDDAVNIEHLGIRDYFESILTNLWEMAAHHDHAEPAYFTEIKDVLLQRAALATEQQRADFKQTQAISLILPRSTIEKCIDACLLSVKADGICFSMPLVQDYFAACALIQFGVPSQLPTLALDDQFRRTSQRWDKAIIMASHLAERKETILEIVAKADPLLALDCIHSGVSVASSLYSTIIEQNLLSLITIGDFRVDFARRLRAFDPKAAKGILIEVMRDGHWLNRVDAYNTFVKLSAPFLPGLAEAISQLNDDERTSIAQTLKRFGTDALSTLFTLMREDNAILRSNTAWALGQLQDNACVPALVEALQDNNPRVCKQVVEALDFLQDIDCVPYLSQYLQTQHATLRKTVIRVLANFQEHEPNKFASAIKSLDAKFKILFMQRMNIPSNALVDLLLDLSKDELVDVRLTAIEKLGSHPETRVISRLEDCLDDMSKSKLSKHSISEVVSKVLSNIQKVESKGAISNNGKSVTEIFDDKVLNSSEVVKARLLQVKETRTKQASGNKATVGEMPQNTNQAEPLPNGSSILIADDSYVSAILAQLRERTWTNSSNAAKILREYVKRLHGSASLSVINQILETLNDSDWVIRWTGVETLGWTDNIHVVPHLVQRLTDSNWKIRIAAIRSLAEIGDITAVTGLSVLLSDNNSVVREAAAEALGVLNAKESLSALETAALDQEDFVRLASIESLGKLHQQAGAKTLLTALKDKSEHVRWAAANGLLGIATPEMVPSLIPSLSDTAGPYWEQKRICDVIVDILKQIGSDEALSALANWGNSHV